MKHVVFYNLPNSGASIVMPVLEEFANAAGCDYFSGPSEPERLAVDVAAGKRAFHWTHSGPEVFADFVARDDFRFICLTRDPRDVLVSHVKDFIQRNLHEDKSENELYLEYIDSNCGDMFDDANSWRALEQANVLNITFENIKQNIPLGMRSILDFSELPASDEELQESCARHSFESITKRRRGQTGETVRTQYLYRKGISGDWANQFDGEAALNFHQGFGGIMRQWNYESNGEWARAHARYKSADRLSARAKLGNLLGKRNSDTVQA
jgi:hypothetical protein|tara:strand:- start:1243 stop:2046 length:804 start_codon:yes stop_codon:yes gene_type:complete